MAVTMIDAAPAPRAATRQDRTSDLLVLALVALMLVAGAILKLVVENETRTLTAEGISLSYPATWQVSNAAGDGVIRVRDTRAAGYPTTFEFRKLAANAEVPAPQSLSLAANNLALTRGQDLRLFKILSMATQMTIYNHPGAQVRYVFVADSSNALRETIPVVVRGEDWLVLKDNDIYVFTMLATEENMGGATPPFARFAASANLR